MNTKTRSLFYLYVMMAGFVFLSCEMSQEIEQKEPESPIPAEIIANGQRRPLQEEIETLEHINNAKTSPGQFYNTIKNNKDPSISILANEDMKGVESWGAPIGRTKGIYFAALELALWLASDNEYDYAGYEALANSGTVGLKRFLREGNGIIALVVDAKDPLIAAAKVVKSCGEWGLGDNLFAGIAIVDNLCVYIVAANVVDKEKLPQKMNIAGANIVCSYDGLPDESYSLFKATSPTAYNAVIKNVAEAVIAEKRCTTTHDKTEALLYWEVTHMAYMYEGGYASNVASNLITGKDDCHTAKCDGYASAFTALLRSVNIKVRKLRGFTFPVENGVGHAWNQVYDDVQKKWFMFDPTWTDDDSSNPASYNRSFYWTWRPGFNNDDNGIRRSTRL
ncbi:MAG: transglutaminase-like domain-containing protein [Spirochaetaceae bacterium]|jgi:hypothetical protein|nr:transglutaminase-like domain-containing protein [Spirochaetaceae bacterium]